MATIKNVEELVAVWNRVFETDDPVKSLKAQGVLLTPELEQKFFAPDLQARRLSDEQRARLLKRLKALRPNNFSGEVNFHVRPSLPLSVAKSLPAGEYDLILGIKLDVVDQTLAGLFETHAWPNILKPEDAGQLFKLDELRAFSDDVPNGEGVEVGTLHFSSPPTASFATEDRLIVNQSFKLDLDLVQSSFPRRTTISTLEGTFRWNLQVNAAQDVAEPEKLKIMFASTSQSPQTSQLEISPASPIQPRNSAALQELKNVVFARLTFLLLSQSFSICPIFTIPLGDGVSLRVQRVDVQAIRTFDNVGALMIGVLIGTTPIPDNDSGSPSKLRNAPFANAITNVYFRIHEALTDKLAQAAFKAGTIDSLLPDLDPVIKLKLDSVSVDLKAPNKIRLKARAKFEDFCGPGPFNFKDLHFDVTSDLELVPGLNGQINIIPEGVDINFDNSDLAVCAISGAVDLATVVFSVDTIGELAIIALAKFLGPDLASGKLAFQFKAIFDPKEPIPFTELLPKGEVVQATIRDDALEALGSLTLSRDDLHTFIYLRVSESNTPGVSTPGPVPSSFQLSKPLKGVKVEAIDQDAPAPSGDDVIIPEARTITLEDTKTRTITLTITYEPPQSNERLARGETDKDGLVRLVAARRTFGGKIISTRRFKSKPQKPFEEVKEGVIRRSEQIVNEERSDIFFRLTLPNGKVFDTRFLSGQGFFFQPNFNRRRIGRPDSPLNLILFFPPEQKQ